MRISARITDRNLTHWRSVLSGFEVPPDLVSVRGVPTGAVAARYPRSHGTAADLGGTLVVLQPRIGEHYRGEESLVDFTHPEDAVYLFGSSSEHLTDARDLGGREPEHLVYIPQERQMADWVACACVLYDRLVKGP